MKSYLISCSLVIEHIKYSKADTPHGARSAENHWSVGTLQGGASFTGTSLTCQRLVQIYLCYNFGRSEGLAQCKAYDDRIQEPTN